MFNLANKLTMLRILAAPVMVVLLYFPNRVSCFIAVLVFAAACVTDMVDGLVARRGNMVTNFGKFLDPLADKLLIGSVLIMLVKLGWAPAWVVVVIIGRELAVTGLRAMAADQGMVMAADTFGKIKTMLQIASLVPLVLHYPVAGFDPAPLGMWLLYAALAVTVFSGANYVFNFYKNWLYEENTSR